ncbi:hypothetical protein EUX98_g3165 [Antrodiella citrinella]|uniref:Uncharacterized protein n=1 Tax=Antrodiella citrinella TaxID=2447956 RepID=A0A4S4MX94_9APHY|nr:hypothetical protein EUX98_g3165 [Antrodiella citrinella]
MADDTKGASNNERLLAAAKQDDLDLILEVFGAGEFDINFQDGLGNTALHYAASLGCPDVLEEILSYDGCDVDPINRMEKATPLHLAVRIDDPEMRKYVVDSLLEAGADVTYVLRVFLLPKVILNVMYLRSFRIKDKNGDTALNCIPLSDTETRALFRRQQASASVNHDDVVDGMCTHGYCAM